MVVVGGGPAGSTAAIQAARLGATTLLVEKNGMLGGTTTAAAIDIPGLFHAWGRQVIAGIGWEVVRRAVELAGDELPDFTDYDQRAYKLSVQLRREVYATLLDQAVLDSGATLRFHTMVGAVTREGPDWRLTLCGKEGLFDVHCSVLIDCTGDANAIALAGFELERSVDRQPATYSACFSGYDPAALDYEALEKARDAAVETGQLLPDRPACPRGRRPRVPALQRPQLDAHPRRGRQHQRGPDPGRGRRSRAASCGSSHSSAPSLASSG